MEGGCFKFKADLKRGFIFNLPHLCDFSIRTINKSELNGQKKSVCGKCRLFYQHQELHEINKLNDGFWPL